MLQKGVFPYEYMDDWETFYKTLSKKEHFYSHLNMEDITDADYAHIKKELLRFWNKKFRGISWFAFQKWLLLANVFVNFRNMCLKIYKLDPAKFLSAPGLAWQAALKKTKVKLYGLTGINILIMVEKCITGGICHSIYQYA